MENYEQLQMEIDSLLPSTESESWNPESLSEYGTSEVDLEPNVVEASSYSGGAEFYLDDFMGDDNIILDEEFAEDYLVEDYDDDYEDDYGERRRRRRRGSSAKTAKSAHKMAVINKKNIIRLNRGLGKLGKRVRINSINIGKQGKRLTAYVRSNNRAHRKFQIDIARSQKAIRRVTKMTADNSRQLENAAWMAIPRAAGNLVSNQITRLELRAVNGTDTVEYDVISQTNNPIAALAPSVADFATLIGRNTKVNRWALLGISLVLSLGMGARPGNGNQTSILSAVSTN